MATVDAMQRANKEMKKQYKNIDIDKIEVDAPFSPSFDFPTGLTKDEWMCASPLFRLQSIHYDMEDLIDQANEIQESLGRSYGVPDEIDESDLQAGPSLLSLSVFHPTKNPLGLNLYFLFIHLELDALADESYAEEESEGALPSYLRDTNTLPDFVDPDPVPEVSLTPSLFSFFLPLYSKPKVDFYSYYFLFFIFKSLPHPLNQKWPAERFLNLLAHVVFPSPPSFVTPLPPQIMILTIGFYESKTRTIQI